MSRLIPALVLAIGLSLTPTVFAASDPMEGCAKETDDAARLACFDKVIAARRAATGEKQKQVNEEAGLQGQALHKKQQQEGVAPPVAATKVDITATLNRVDRRPGNAVALELDNGQVWETVETRSDLVLNPHETVTIKAGGLGGFLLKNSAKQVVRVRRLR